MEFIVEKITKDSDVTIAKVDDFEEACKVMQDDAFTNYPEDAEICKWEELICDVCDSFRINNEFIMKLISVTYRVVINYDESKN